MSDSLEWQIDHVPEGIRDKVKRGEVPLPTGDGSDPIRNIRYAVAVAEDAGNWSEVDRLNLQWVDLLRRGKDEGSWTPPQVDVYGRGTPATRSQLVEAARKAEEAGNHEAANSFKLKAMRALHDVDPELVKQAREAERNLQENMDAPLGEREQLLQEVDRANFAIISAQRGDPKPEPPAPPPPPKTVQELSDARREAEQASSRAFTAGNHQEAREQLARVDKINAELIARERQRRDPTHVPATNTNQE